MPRSAKLKVYRTPIGFHDAYVAAPSKKAAMEAWGSGKDLFTRGEAEEVTEPELTAEPLASPGQVIKRLRATAEEQVAALGETKSKSIKPPRKAEPKQKRPPRPSREALDEAEAALVKAEERHRVELKEISDREAALARERNALVEAHAKEADRLTRRRDEAEYDYQQAMRRWRG
ncbi:MAG TPA: hypothetical protein VNT25_06555 [Allosphingosinicella sp.]|nr:hypothetical protein [Allosphingosinicella sp.]